MTVIAEFTIPSAEFILGEVLQQTTGAHVEVERVVPVGSRLMPYVWVSGCDFEEFEYHVRASEHVDALNALDRVHDSVLYSVEWAESVESLMVGFVRSNATILEANGNETWQFRIRFEDHANLSDFHNYCVDHDITYTVDRIYTLDQSSSAIDRFALTPEQREALVAAIEKGYFEVPRRSSLADLAAEFDISQQAASERVRRGAGKVLSAVLLDRSADEL
jgi:predicted DNA binding protein